MVFLFLLYWWKYNDFIHYRMKMKEDGQSYLQPSSAKKSKLGAEPRAQEERLEVLHKVSLSIRWKIVLIIMIFEPIYIMHG